MVDKMRFDKSSLIEFLEGLTHQQPNGLQLLAKGPSVVWSKADGEDEENHLMLPLTAPVPHPSESLGDYLERLEDPPDPYVIVLMRAGTASMGYYIEGELEAHKVIRKYMVRKKQGRMQLAYLNSKGKSRAGSRVRLRESVEFFEEINQKLADWFEEFGEPDRVFHSCPVRLISYWFASRVAPPFEPEDDRLIRIPHHVHQPDHDELLRINRLITSATLVEP